MKYFQFIRNVVLLVLLGTLAGCQNDELIVDMGQGQDKIVLSFSDAGHSMTRVSSQEDYTTPTDVEKAVTHIDVFFRKNRHKAQRKAKFYINKCRSASCMQSGWKRTPA